MTRASVREQTASRFRELLESRMKTARSRIDVNLQELDRVLDRARQVPLNAADCEKVKEALHALAAMLAPVRTTERPAPC